ncbi:hypothetical protein Bpro_3005 [Polaromonas sp. JS666]|nr:hypothetical protein Bpro_3005 [Polaromonas sp. JS666]
MAMGVAEGATAALGSGTWGGSLGDLVSGQPASNMAARLNGKRYFMRSPEQSSCNTEIIGRRAALCQSAALIGGGGLHGNVGKGLPCCLMRPPIS